MIKNLAGSKLSKTGSHRKSMLLNMTTSLLMHEEISTTLPKARALRRAAEKIITQARGGKHVLVRRSIKDKVVFKKLFDVLVPRYASRPGGYTRILKIGRRRGDNTEMTLVKLAE